MRGKKLMLLLVALLLPIYAIDVEISQERTFYGKDGVLTVTVCDTSISSVTISLKGGGLSFTPNQIETKLFGSATVPDCVVEEISVHANNYGSYTAEISVEDVKKSVRLNFIPLSDPILTIPQLEIGIHEVPVAVSYPCNGEVFVSFPAEECMGQCNFYLTDLPATVYPILRITPGMESVTVNLKVKCGDIVNELTKSVPVNVRDTKPIEVELVSGKFQKVCIPLPSWTEKRRFLVSVDGCFDTEGIVEGGTACFYVKPSCGSGIYDGKLSIDGIDLLLKARVVENASIWSFANVEGNSVELIVVNALNGEIRNVAVTVSGSGYVYHEFLGKLEGGDYDTVDLTLPAGRYSYVVVYEENGVKYTHTGGFEVKGKKESINPLLILALMVIGLGAWKAYSSRGKTRTSEEG